MEKARMDVKDQISQLPEAILHQIFSSLPIKEVFRASVLAKSWKDICSTYPFLDFGPSFFQHAGQRIDLRKTAELLNVVDVILARMLEKNASIEIFRLSLPSCNEVNLQPYIDRFLGCITQCNIKELAFIASAFRYTLPEAVYAAKSLVKLELAEFILKSPSAAIQFSSLRELHLFTVSTDNELIRLLISSCLDLEVLYLARCEGFDSLEVLGLLKLKKIELCCCLNLINIEIQAPNLEHLYIHSLNELHVFSLIECKNLKFLRLYHLNLQSLRLYNGFAATNNWMDGLFSDLPLLEHFSLLNCYVFQTLQILSNSLKRLMLWGCYGLVKAEIDTPNLSSFNYNDKLSRLSLKALALQDIALESEDLQISCSNELIEWLGSLNHCKAMMLTSSDPELITNLDPMKELFHPPLYELKHLSLRQHTAVRSSRLLDLLENLLWLAPRLDTLSCVCDTTEMTLQFVYYENPMAEVENLCCSFLPIQCWRHSLKKVIFKQLKGLKDQRMWMNYFVENAKALESVDGLKQSVL